MMQHPHIPRLLAQLATICLAATVCLTSCDKVPINGDLDGMWQLMSIQTPDGLRDTRADRSYVSVQLHLTMWERKHENLRYYAHFNHIGDSLLFFDFAHSSGHRNASETDTLITAQEMSDGLFDAWGIHTPDARFHIDHLSGKSLVLHSGDTVLTFRKF